MSSAQRRVHVREDHVYLAEVTCDPPGRGWSEVRPAPVFGLVLLRRGLLRVRAEGTEQLLDAAGVYVERLGTEQQFAHPRGADVFTEIVLSESRVASLLGDDPTVPEGQVVVTPELALAHRMLLGRARAGADTFELGERTAALTAVALAQLDPSRADSGRPSAARARRRLADDARAALSVDPNMSLEALARAVGAAPHHLSRTFTALTGVTLTGFRNRLRFTAAMERLAEGERDLALLAHELGFSDQAHMTRVLQRTAGVTPGRLRELVGPPCHPEKGRRA